MKGPAQPITTGVGHCNASLLVLAQRRDAIPYVLSGLSDAIEVAIIRQFGRYPPSAVDDQAIRLRATHQLVEGARIDKIWGRRLARAMLALQVALAGNP